MSEKEFNKILEKLKSTLKCPLCGKAYDKNEIKYLGTFNFSYLLEMNCQHCDLAVMATVIMNPQKNKLDLIRGELKKFEEAEEISADELIELHEFLDKFDGNFKKALRAKK
ncbi:TPA: hypothetical protein DDW69_04245 [candidate division CPR2 bacterium]|uniref:Uncharacterized protein n=1 Tax=candidate division CPR2 bacterium GW2011_GWC1_41_48 TaxID=1618344 RepID=A0A0G0W8E4_UNCC2|nr:MAG: hypothetical protein UT47_C0002G0267 [candidate division CPR2 bacterium GW2011_GWC2_39_35]KKR28037.1 MAG: hypothetical protein UT60_C0029G0008 [candidate division CPR2 bacterium GW2011_GWD2_39_7]KKS09259.1 MAG: hypothetical protein UU65_C0002G0037 [candidate division CPR2 bacterium GW2011_GWC1_41_48]OGB72148.1 MAG: hypothetical protein A2Y26_04930 [candidate division CPR2 bacterium GWD2_39_7]HBG82015.1 hypothetical protein [candidate division CPR2 bacterium]